MSKPNPYWQLAKMAFVLGAASAAGNFVVTTAHKLAHRAGEMLVTMREEPEPEAEEAKDAGADATS